MSEDTKEESENKPDIARKEVVALAKALFRVQNRKSDADEGDKADKGDKVSFKDAKAEMLPLARRTLRNLHKQGYSLTES